MSFAAAMIISDDASMNSGSVASDVSRSDGVSKPNVRLERTSHQRPLRVAVVGCGAIVRDFHLPVLAGHPDVVLAALVDRQLDSAARLAKLYGVKNIHADAGELSAADVDAVVIATPPQHHAECSIEMLSHGLHVFVEKPMALSADDAVAMIGAAEDADRCLAVGMFRRLTPANRLLRSLIQAEALGAPQSFEIEEGHVFDWPSATLALMKKELAGGGVLMDTGYHTLDQLLSFFDGPVELLEYRDNALGGIESDCMLRLRITHHGRQIEGSIELSRTRTLRNQFRIQCERGVLELPTSERTSVKLLPNDIRLVDPATGKRVSHCLTAKWDRQDCDDIRAPFRMQIDDWVGAIFNGGPPQLSGSTLMGVARLIDACYRARKPLVEPWVSEGLPAVPSRSNSAPIKVLVTGAAGFIGCRLTEILALKYGCDVRAMVHRPGSASRLSRLPVDLIQADICSRDDVNRAVNGCDAVVHCAYGTAWGDRREIEAVTVGGTRALSEAALRYGVSRFVHLSTVAIHGLPNVATIDEATPVRPPRGQVYAQSKARAEKAVLQASRRGLAAVIIRPAYVYGPFSQPFTIRPIRDLIAGLPVLVGAGENPSNTVYVDNLVELIWLAMNGPEQEIRGETFLAVDDDGLTWEAFHRPLAVAAGVNMASVTLDGLHHMRTQKTRWSPMSWLRETKELLMGAEALNWGKQLLMSPHWGWPLRTLLESSPRLKSRIQDIVSPEIALKYSTERSYSSPNASLELLDLYASCAEMRADKARRVLGFAPAVSRERAIVNTVSWLKAAGLVH